MSNVLSIPELKPKLEVRKRLQDLEQGQQEHLRLLRKVLDNEEVFKLHEEKSRALVKSLVKSYIQLLEARRAVLRFLDSLQKG